MNVIYLLLTQVITSVPEDDQFHVHGAAAGLGLLTGFAICVLCTTYQQVFFLNKRPGQE